MLISLLGSRARVTVVTDAGFMRRLTVFRRPLVPENPKARFLKTRRVVFLITRHLVPKNPKIVPDNPRWVPENPKASSCAT